MKTSFKTTTLIAAIGMSIAVGYNLIVTFINLFTGIDLYVHPIRMQALWRLYDAVWWSSVLIFFWGMFRYSDQLPELNKLSTRIAIALVGIIALMYFDGLFYTSFSDPLWLKISRYTLRFVTKCSYVAAMWWCYAKSADRQVETIRYISFAAVLLCGATTLNIIGSTIAWWFGVGSRSALFFSYDTMFMLICVIYIAAVACALIGIYPEKTTQKVGANEHKQIQLMTIGGWTLLAAFVLDATWVGIAIARPCIPDWLLIAIVLFFFAMPVIAGIYLFIACRTLQKTYNIILEQQKQSK